MKGQNTHTSNSIAQSNQILRGDRTRREASLGPSLTCPRPVLGEYPAGWGIFDKSAEAPSVCGSVLVQVNDISYRKSFSNSTQDFVM